ncbi:TetR family transcriptional regulator C-terminal domain-containing protein, partial [Mycobacterium tuberculosis]
FRIQHVYQRRMLSNLRHPLRALVPVEEAPALAATIAAMIDGVWLRGALSGWSEIDGDSARHLLGSFVDSRLAAMPAAAPPRREIVPCNPATGEALARIAVTDTPALEAAIARA